MLLGAGSSVAASFSEHFIPADPAAPPLDILVNDAKGQSLRLADFRGHPVIISLWAAWCGPCLEEMPSLDALQAGSAQLTVIALDEERSVSTDTVASFYKRHNIGHLAVYLDPTGHLTSSLHARGLPTSYLIDADGKWVGSVEGGVDWAAPATRDFLTQKGMVSP